MKIRILGWEYQNIRKIESLKIALDVEKDIHFFMMSNGTGKTTTINLMRAIFDRSVDKWDEKVIKEYAPRNKKVEEGFFSLDFKLDDRQYTIKILLNYVNKTAYYQTISAAQIGGGKEDSWKLKSFYSDIFSEQFVSRFIFDGEQAKKTMSNKSKEAEDAIHYLYRLNIFDDISGKASSYLEKMKEKGARGGSDQGFKKMKTVLQNKKAQEEELKLKESRLEAGLKELEDRISENKARVDDSLAKEVGLNQQKKNKEDEKRRIAQDIINTVVDAKRLLRLTQATAPKFNTIMTRLAKNMQTLKLPRSVSKDFFNALANSPKCICDRDIGESEREIILKKAEEFLGEEQLIALNAIKDKLGSNVSNESTLLAAIDRLRDLNDEHDKVVASIERINDKLLEGADDEIKAIQQSIDADEASKLEKQAEYDILTCKKTTTTHNERNNLKLAEEKTREAQEAVDKATKTVESRKRVEKFQKYCKEVKRRALEKLKKSIIEKANEKIASIITTDDIKIIEIKDSIILDRAAGSEGQSLDIAYAFIGTLFEESSFQFPFVIDSPAGKIDFTVRKEIARCLPEFFDQLIVFVIPPEVKDFADVFYKNDKAEFATIISKEELEQMGLVGDKARCEYGQDFFDKFQNTIKEDEK